MLAANMTGCSSHQSRDQARSEQGGGETREGSGRVEYDSNQLMMKSADEIGEIVRRKIKKAQDIQAHQVQNDDEGLSAEGGAIRQLKDATRIVLARPDQDGTRAAAFARLRRELSDLNASDSTLSELGQEGVVALKSGATPIRRQATYLVLLENLMAEIRPEVTSNDTFRSIITDIRDANIRLSGQLKSQALLVSMSHPVSPSETAANILTKDLAAEKNAQKEGRKKK